MNNLSQKAYIVLVNWNGWRDTILCLESVLRLNHSDYVVVVCDNASTDGSMEHIKAWCSGTQAATGGCTELARLTTPAIPKPIPYIELDRVQAEAGEGADTRLVLVHTGANLGFAGGNNVGFRYALARRDAAYVWALNNDTVVEPDALSALTQHMSNNKNIGICGSTVSFMHKPETFQSLGGGIFNSWLGTGALIGAQKTNFSISSEQEYDIEKSMSFVFGAAMLTSVEFLQKVGLMHEDYFLFFEELDWALRAKKENYILGYCSKSKVFHSAGASTGSGVESAFSIFYLFKSRLQFYKKFYPHKLLISYPRMWLEATKAAIKGDITRCKAISCALLGIALFDAKK